MTRLSFNATLVERSAVAKSIVEVCLCVCMCNQIVASMQGKNIGQSALPIFLATICTQVV